MEEEEQGVHREGSTMSVRSFALIRLTIPQIVAIPPFSLWLQISDQITIVQP